MFLLFSISQYASNLIFTLIILSLPNKLLIFIFLKLVKSICFNSVHPSNMLVVFWTLFILKFDKLIEVKDVQL